MTELDPVKIKRMDDAELQTHFMLEEGLDAATAARKVKNLRTLWVETTFNSEKGQIKGVDGQWYDVPSPVLVRYMLAVGFYNSAVLTDERLD